MLKSTRKLLILAAVVLGLGLSAAPQAEAGWWHRGCGYRYHGYYGYYGYYGLGWGHYGWRSCWAPAYTVRTCSPWYGYCARPVVRHCYVPYRVHSCCSVCYADPCCCYGSDYVSSAVSVVDSPSDVQATQKPTLAPPANPAPGPAAGTPNDPAPAAAPKTFAKPEPPPAPAPGLKLDADPAPAVDPLGPMPTKDTLPPLNAPSQHHPIAPRSGRTQQGVGSPATAERNLTRE